LDGRVLFKRPNFEVSNGWAEAAIDFNDLGDLFVPMWLIFNFLGNRWENAGRNGELCCLHWALIGAVCEPTNPSIKLSVSIRSENKKQSANAPKPKQPQTIAHQTKNVHSTKTQVPTYSKPTIKRINVKLKIRNFWVLAAMKYEQKTVKRNLFKAVMIHNPPY